MKKNLLLVLLFIAIIFFGRILPHPYNFTPLIAIALLSGHALPNKFLAIFAPLFGFWLSDLVINNIFYAGYYSNFTIFSSGMIWSYGAILIIALFGKSFINKISSSKIALASLSGSTIFYLISNFGVWALSPMYAKTVLGLIQCYTLALPFYATSLMGDLLYCSLLFGAYQLVISNNPNFLISKSKT